jgi:hypothetical protein
MLSLVVARVELPIIKHVLIAKNVPIIKQFPMVSSLLNQIEPFLCHWMRKLEGYKCSLSVRSEGAKEKTQDEDD